MAVFQNVSPPRKRHLVDSIPYPPFCLLFDPYVSWLFVTISPGSVIWSSTLKVAHLPPSGLVHLLVSVNAFSLDIELHPPTIRK